MTHDERRSDLNPIFSYAGLSDFLKELAAQFSIFPLREWHGQPGIVLRHDVDLDPVFAWRLAEVEQALGLRSTFFFLVTGQYNVASAANRRLIREIGERGFEIGLHFDPAIYGFGSQDELAAAAEDERRFLEGIAQSRIESISLHNPSIHDSYPRFAGWRNAYDPMIFSEDIYLSDSRMVFRTDPRTFLSRAHDRTLQLLLHPMHYSEKGDPYPGSILECIRRVAQQLDASFMVNSAYARAVGESFFTLLADAAIRWRNEHVRVQDK